MLYPWKCDHPAWVQDTLGSTCVSCGLSRPRLVGREDYDGPVLSPTGDETEDGSAYEEEVADASSR